jgi:hypothetical protein
VVAAGSSPGSAASKEQGQSAEASICHSRLVSPVLVSRSSTSRDDESFRVRRHSSRDFVIDADRVFLIPAGVRVSCLCPIRPGTTGVSPFQPVAAARFLSQHGCRRSVG